MGSGSGKTAVTVPEARFSSAPQARRNETSNAASTCRALFRAGRAESLPEARNEPVFRGCSTPVDGEPFGGPAGGGRTGSSPIGTHR